MAAWRTNWIARACYLSVLPLGDERKNKKSGRNNHAPLESVELHKLPSAALRPWCSGGVNEHGLQGLLGVLRNPCCPLCWCDDMRVDLQRTKLLAFGSLSLLVWRYDAIINEGQLISIAEQR